MEEAMEAAKKWVWSFFNGLPQEGANDHETTALLEEEHDEAEEANVDASEHPKSKAKVVKREKEAKVVQRSRSKTPEKKAASSTKTPKKTPKKAESPVIKSTPKQSNRFSLDWTAKSTVKLFAKDAGSKAWYEATIVDVIPKDDTRAKLATVDIKKRMRGLKAPFMKTPPLSVKVEEGDWVRIHYFGYNDRYDEWLLFQTGGYLCLGDEIDCMCARHI